MPTMPIRSQELSPTALLCIDISDEHLRRDHLEGSRKLLQTSNYVQSIAGEWHAMIQRAGSPATIMPERAAKAIRSSLFIILGLELHLEYTSTLRKAGVGTGKMQGWVQQGRMVTIKVKA